MTALVEQVRAIVPRSMQLPAQNMPARIEIQLDVAEDGQVVAPGLAQLEPALAVGAVELVRSYCEMWTQWLAWSVREVGR